MISPKFVSQVETQQLDFAAHASSKIGSTDNIDHDAGGGVTKVSIYIYTGY